MTPEEQAVTDTASLISIVGFLVANQYSPVHDNAVRNGLFLNRHFQGE
jgi:hypothetical protein